MISAERIAELCAANGFTLAQFWGSDEPSEAPSSFVERRLAELADAE